VFLFGIDRPEADDCDRIVVCGGDGDCTEARPNCCPAMGGIFDICVEDPCE